MRLVKKRELNPLAINQFVCLVIIREKAYFFEDKNLAKEANFDQCFGIFQSKAVRTLTIFNYFNWTRLVDTNYKSNLNFFYLRQMLSFKVSQCQCQTTNVILSTGQINYFITIKELYFKNHQTHILQTSFHYHVLFK